MRHAAARAPIEAMLGHPDKNVRIQAAKALKRIDEAAA
jgi:HEAT repeat protein